jgi:hypothetical protein
MEPPVPDPLRQADDLIRSGKPSAAQAILVEYVRQNPASEQGWLLLSLTMTDPQKQIDCLRMVLRINPDHPIASSRLSQLLFDASFSPEPDASPSPQSGPMENSTGPGDAAGTTVPPFTDIEPELLESLSGPFPSPGVTQGSRPKSKRPSAPPSTRSGRRSNRTLLVVGIVLALLAVAIAPFALVGLKNYREFILNPTRVALLATVKAQHTMPATWTPTSTPPDTPTPTVTPIPPPTETPTLPVPAPTAAAQMDLIQKQVADLRGLDIQGDVPRYVVNRGVAEQVLTSYLVSSGYEAELRDEAQVLSALGLIKPTYDMVNYVLNGMVDNIGGVYIPWDRQIFVLGLQFTGIEHYVYSHEYDHALVDQHYHIGALGVYPRCLSNAQRCVAIQALVEGDATLLMNQWWRQYATPHDYQDIMNYRPPLMAIPDQFPPPYVGMDVSFPYVYGYEFVKSLYDRGNWARVNQAYANLPESTEQILHIQKYLGHEAPVAVADPPLSATLGSDWRELKRDVLGEWTTYLILGYGADLAAQQKDGDASKAAAGWGGDAYQAYVSNRTGDVLLAAHWVWDNPAEAKQFNPVMLAYLDGRFRGNKLIRPGGSCWQANGQTTCLFSRGSGSLWLIVPDEGLIETVLSHYPDFK